MTDIAEALQHWHGLSIDELALKIASASKEARDEIVGAALDFTANMKWVPQPGPQTSAFFSQADVLFFGGQAGGGKTDLGLGLALTTHKRSLVLREQYVELSFLTDRTIKMNGTRAGFNGSSPPSLRTSDGRYIQFAGASIETLEDWMGIPFDLKFFDEAVKFPEKVIRFHIGWLRSAEPGQRTRAVLASNPPVNPQGEWIIKMFAPWLDPMHHNPAKPGELRWYVTDPDGEDFEVPGPEPYQFNDGSKPVRPLSRTFIPSKLSDNAYYANSDYEAKLDAMQEPYRSAFRDGNFMAARQDQESQVLPTAWLNAARKRWKPDIDKEVQMTCIAADVGAGGNDRVTLARRHAEWYAPMIAVPGKEAPDGSTQAALIIRYRRDQCGIVVDVGGGYGGDVVGRLKDNELTVTRFNASEGSSARAKDGSGKTFVNKRAEAWWRFREALNPDQTGGSLVALPDDPELISELAAVCFIPDIAKVQIEDKKDVRKRLGRSPDKADAVVMAWAPGDVAVKRVRFGNGVSAGERPERANIGYSSIKSGFIRPT